MCGFFYHEKHKVHERKNGSYGIKYLSQFSNFCVLRDFRGSKLLWLVFSEMNGQVGEVTRNYDFERI
jgi:hypothetical protein